jgi:uncharacterized protein YndB with AHSA1/START domain
MSTSLKFVHTLNTPASQVYRAFTNATALREWLCDTASVDPKPGGRFYIAWNGGYYASGEYVKLQADSEVVFIWSGRDDPSPTRVTLTLKSLDNGATTFSLEHTGLDNTPAWTKAKDEISRGWNEGLDNLMSILENGHDLRITRRPMMGVMFGDFNKKKAEELGVPVSEGLRLDSTVDGSGAQKAGLRKNDVIVTFAGKPATDFNTVINQLQHKKAGESVEVGFYRGADKKHVEMELAARPLPEIPKTAKQFGEMLQKLFAESDAELKAALEGVSDAQAAHKLSPDEWSAMEVIAHLIHEQRDYHAWINDMVYSQERVSDGFGDNLPARISATAAVYDSKDAILEEFFRNEQETVYLVSHLSDDFIADKAGFWRVAFILLQTPFHTKDHTDQIKAAVGAARK